MKIKQFILNIVLSICNFITKFLKIDQNKIAFVSLEGKELSGDLKMIYDRLKDKDYKLVCVLTEFRNNGLLMNFLYFLNTIKQIFVINTSKLVIINDNNYVISKYKKEGVKVLQIWHACGAIKKFGNIMNRTYKIANYDYVLACGNYWKKPYSEAFGVSEDSVIVTGLPKLDLLCDQGTLKKRFYAKHPDLKDKHIILYAPTFRGNIYKGMKQVNINLDKVAKSLKGQYVILYKLHPLLKDVSLGSSEFVINMNDSDLYELFSVSDLLVSDFSSIILDYSLLDKPIYYYAPDVDKYISKRGCFIDYKAITEGLLAKNEEELAALIKSRIKGNEELLRKRFMDHHDDQNTQRVIDLIQKIMN